MGSQLDILFLRSSIPRPIHAAGACRLALADVKHPLDLPCEAGGNFGLLTVTAKLAGRFAALKVAGAWLIAEQLASRSYLHTLGD